MTPAACIAALNRVLAAHGEDIRLQRLMGTQQVPVEVACRAHVRGYEPHELVGGIAQGDSRVLISPTEIEAAQWPGGQVEGAVVGDARVPKKGDRLFIAGRARQVEAVKPIYLDGELVRIEMAVRG